MKILITGGLGFVGRRLSRLLLEAGHSVTAIGLRANPEPLRHDHFDYISADTTRPGEWQLAVQTADAAINLAGKSIFHLWTEAYKQQMYDSRILTTRHLVEALPGGGNFTLISTSAVGCYGDGGERILAEDAASGDDFLARLSRDWEAEAVRAEEKKARVVIPRFGIVLAAGGGALGLMIPAFRYYLGGELGNGRQWFPWIHMADLLGAYQFLFENRDIRGPLNLCAPNPVRNRHLTEVMARLLNRPAFMPAPAFVLRTLLGELGRVLLNSQRAVPQRLLNSGFRFQYPTMEEALTEIVKGRGDQQHKLSGNSKSLDG